MIQSMTGYGKAIGHFSNKKITIEIRSLNSKSADIYLKIPSAFKSFEIPIRKEIQGQLQRGKIECTITEELISIETSAINLELVSTYYKELSGLADRLNADKSSLLPAILRMPEVNQYKEDSVVEEGEWQEIQNLITKACDKLSLYRIEEGKSIIDDFEKSVNAIEEALSNVTKYEEERISAIKEKMHKSLKGISDNIDENRFEQELIYYIEKLDINEEKTRLRQHIEYFRNTMCNKDAVGKKLGFISQEMGREINTLGSKSYHAELQKLVVNMKDNLEKIKEQVLNTL